MEKSRILGTFVCYVILKEANIQISFICARFKFFLGVAGSEDFACATLPTTPLDFQAKV